METATVATAQDIAFLLNEITRLHDRLDNYERTIATLAKALESNPMLKAMIPGGFGK